MKNNKFITMAFESSCDETAIAVLADGREVLSNAISSQIDIFKNYGGVVPEIAARHHLENINEVVDEALAKREIVKFRVLESAMISVRDAAEAVAEGTDAQVVTVIGSKAVIYRRSEDNILEI